MSAGRGLGAGALLAALPRAAARATKVCKLSVCAIVNFSIPCPQCLTGVTMYALQKAFGLHPGFQQSHTQQGFARGWWGGGGIGEGNLGQETAKSL